MINMRKSILLAGLLFLGLQMHAQEKPIISSAVIAYNKGVSMEALKEAKMYIDQAREVIEGKSVSEVNPKQLTKFYYHYGDIYFRIANSRDEAIVALDADAIEKAAWGYFQLLDAEKGENKPAYSKRVTDNLPFLAGNIINRGIAKSELKDFQGAMEDFLRVFEMKKLPPFSETDTSLLYNAAIMAQAFEDKSVAYGLYNQLLKMEYKGLNYSALDAKTGKTVAFKDATTMDVQVNKGTVVEPKVSESILPSLYITNIALAKMLGKNDDMNALIKEGRAKFPRDQELIKFELQYFFDIQDFDGAINNLLLALEKEPTNALYLYNTGIIYQTKLNNIEKGREFYMKTIEVDPTYFEAMYMLGVTYVNDANKFTERLNKLGLKDEKKYNQLKKEQEGVFKTALKYFEMGYQVNPKDENLVEALQKIYYNLGMLEKSLKMRDELEAIQN
jgi:tetratricopeptide (TPR) repeat protein